MYNYEKIDEYIAKHVLNWRLDKDGYWITEEGDLTGYKHYSFYKEKTDKVRYFRPSIDMNDAMVVADELKIAIIPQAGEPPRNMRYMAEIDRQPFGNYHDVFAETAPLAVCLVALEYAGIDLEEFII